MTDVYRAGTKSVHRAILADGHRFDVNECQLDPGGAWSPVRPPGAPCQACFGDVHGKARPRNRLLMGRPGRKAAAVSGASTLALVAAIWAANPGGTVMPSPSPSYFASITIPSSTPDSASFVASPVPTPEPSKATSTPTAAPVVPRWRVILRLLFPEGPGRTRTFPDPTTPRPSPPPLPAPTCRHPGEHIGAPACKWPHN